MNRWFAILIVGLCGLGLPLIATAKTSALRNYRGQVCATKKTVTPRYGVISAYSGTEELVRSALNICILNADAWADNPRDAGACDSVPRERTYVYVAKTLPPSRGARFDAAWLEDTKTAIVDAMNRRPRASGIWLDTVDVYWHRAGTLADFQRNVPRLVQWAHTQGWKIGGNVAVNQLPSNLPEIQRFDLAAIERTGDDGSRGNPVNQSVVPSIRMALNSFPVKAGGKTLMVHAPIEGDRALALGVTTGADHVLVGPGLGEFTDCGTTNWPCWGHGGTPFNSNLGACSRSCEILPGRFKSVCERGEVYWNDTGKTWLKAGRSVLPHNGLIVRK